MTQLSAPSPHGPDYSGTYAPIAQQLARRRNKGMVPISTRCNMVGTTLSSGSATGGTTGITHTMLSSGHGIVVCYANVYALNGVDTPGPQAITVRASLEINPTVGGGTIVDVYFNGQRSVTLDPGAVIFSDEVAIDYTVGDSIRSRTHHIVPVAATKYPVGFSRVYAPDSVFTTEWTNDASPGADWTDSPASNGTFGGSVYSPACILGRPDPDTQVILGAVHDSLGFGTGDYNADIGFLSRFATANFVPIARVGMPGGQMNFDLAANGYKGRYVPLEGCSDILLQLGVNDYRGGGRSVAQMQADTLTFGTRLARRGAQRLWRSTITPSTISTDNFTSVANQTPNVNEANRVAFNAWVRDGMPIVAGAAVAVGTTGGTVSRCRVYDSAGALVTAASGPAHPYYGTVELADVCESARDSGKFVMPSNFRARTDVAMTSGSNTLTSASANFTSADLGASVVVAGAAAAGATLVTNIIKVTSTTSVQVLTAASTTVSNASTTIGTPTTDGVHPSGRLHANMSNAIPLAAMQAALT